MPKMVDMTGQKFGRLTVIEKADKDNRGEIKWRCLCDCGNEILTTGSRLRIGKTMSCGCYMKEKSRTQGYKNKKHGLRFSRLYGIWVGIKQRCTNIKSGRYDNYIGRGITICDEWLKDFQAFYDWAMANGYKEEVLPNGKNKYTIDRKDNDKGYCPDNCRWVTSKEQQNNTRKNVFIEYEGRIQTVSEWADEYELNHDTFRDRISAGWDMERALTCKPVKGGHY